jgi:hypothetical protein
MLVIPAKAGTPFFYYEWAPAFAGATLQRFRRSKDVVPAKAGIQFFLRMGPRLRGGDGYFASS